MDYKDTKKLCPYYKKCSGCQLQNLSYKEQLSYKQATVIKLLSKFGHIDEIIGMENPFHYRNKLQSAFIGKEYGIYRSTTGKIAQVDNCLIEDEKSQEIVKTLHKLFASFKIKAFDRETGKGLIRHVLIRRGFKSGQIMIVIVTAEGEFPSQRSFTNALLSRFPEITTIVRNINPGGEQLTLGKNSEIFYGNGYIEEQLCCLTFRISPHSFYQINPVQTEILYTTAESFAGLTGNETLIDAYCGTGTIGLIMAKNARRVIGAEVNSSAVADAKINAELNNITNAEFICEDAGKFMTALSEKGENIDVVITDPPRAGCSREFLQSLVKLSPKRVVYISCNPETLARDLQWIVRKGYRVEKIQPVDMFCFTKHCECVVQMSRKAD